MQVLVTGASGFVGSHLVERLVERGDQVSCLVRKTSDRSWLAAVQERVRFVEGDLDDDAALANGLEGAEAVIHAGGATRKTRKTREELFRVNEAGTARLLQACARHAPKLRRFVLVSTLGAVGPGRNGAAVDEATPCAPLTDYGRSKLAGERAALAMKDRLPIAVVRLPAVYGPRDVNLVPLFKLALRGIRLSASRQASWVHVRDAVDALVAAAERPEAQGEIFHASAEDLTVTEIGRAIAGALAVRAVGVPLPRAAIFAAALVSELLGGATLDRQKASDLTASWRAPSEKIRSRLGWAPRWTFAEGMRELAGWYRAAGWIVTS